MKNRPYLTTYVTGLVMGILLCLFYNRPNILTLMVIIIGALIILPSIFGIGKGFAGKKDAEGNRHNLPWYTAAACIIGLVIGILLISFASFFAAYIVYTLGVLLVIAGIVQIMSLVAERHDIGSIKKIWYVIPWLTVGAGIVIVLLGPQKIAGIVIILTGIVLIFYGLNGLLSLMDHHFSKKRAIRAEESEAVRDSEEAAQSEASTGITPDEETTTIEKEENSGD